MNWQLIFFFGWKQKPKPVDLSAKLSPEQLEAARAPIRQEILDLRESLSMEEEVYSKAPEYAEQLKHAKFSRIPH